MAMLNSASTEIPVAMENEINNFPIGPDHLQLYPLPLPDNIKPRPLTTEEESRIDTLSRLQFFLATAPTRWQDNPGMITSRISKFQLPNGECISCVLWNGLYHVTGTDIVRALAFRFEAFGRPIHATKKWEEGVFSDLRNLKPGQDACLEDPKSPLLDFLFRNGCIRTQKKQKVFYWFSVPHDRLFLDALERDLKREKINQEPTSIVVGEPARSFRYDPRRSLYDQFAGQNPGLNVLMRDMVSYNDSMQHHEYPGAYNPIAESYIQPMSQHGYHDDRHMQMHLPMHMHEATPPPLHHHRSMPYTHTAFEGSPNYKRRRMKHRDTPDSGTPMSESARGPSVDVRDTESPDPEHIGDSSFASDESNLLPSLRKNARAKSRARSRLSSRAGSRAGSSDPRDGDSRNFLCPYDFCHRPFKRLEHLKRHVRTHTQERPYVCQRCTRNFSRQDNLAMHMKTHEKLDREGGTMSDEDMRGYSESPGPDMMYGDYSRASSAMPPPSMPYTRHSTLPPNFASGAPTGGSPFQRSGTPSYPMLNVPSYGSPYDAGRRHRSATPYAPTTSSNLAYAQPVIAPPVDMMGAYPTPISANEGGITYSVDAIPMEMAGSADDLTPMQMQHNQMPMQMAMDQEMNMLPVEMQMPMQDYGGMQYDNPTGRGGAPMGWGWRSYEPGAYVPPEQEEGGTEFRE